MIRKPQFYFFALSGLLVSSNLVYAEFYKWVDSDGNVHYTQTPPNQGVVDLESIKPKTSPASESSLERMKQEKEKVNALRDKRLEEKKKAEEQEQFKAVKEKNCQIAKDRLSTYSRPRGLIQQDDGTAIRITEEKRQTELKSANDLVKEWCK